mmetsp:Transcript_35392/g.56851  ORF Transcript_35392/g.56851 Transcript_35392/m.56851 type:complete len:169 (-) Transcript_35392:339-845(-)
MRQAFILFVLFATTLAEGRWLADANKSGAHTIKREELGEKGTLNRTKLETNIIDHAKNLVLSYDGERKVQPSLTVEESLDQKEEIGEDEPSMEHLQESDLFGKIEESLLNDELLYLPEDIEDAENVALPFIDEYAGLLEPDHDDDDQSLSADEYHYMSGMPNHHSNPP